MRILKYRADVERFQMLNCDDAAISYLDQGQFDGTPIASRWSPFEVWWDPASGGERGDFPGFPEPVVSSRAVDAVGDVLLRHGELLPLRCDDGDFFIYNVTDVVDCLDEAASSGRSFPGGRFMWINKHVFNPPAVSGQDVFRIPQLRAGPNIYLTGGFVQLVEQAGLLGLEPVEVWSDIDGPRWLPME